jgi:two-component system, NtrC family, sensor kinase
MTMTSSPVASYRRILLIDDNPSIHDDLRKILNPPPGPSALDAIEADLFGGELPAGDGPEFEIDSAFQGQEGLTLVHKAHDDDRPYAMAFVDVRMPPGWDGVETISRIWEKYPELQIVICTAYSDYSNDEMIGKLGGDDKLVILRKPFETNEIIELATRMTEKWRMRAEARA